VFYCSWRKGVLKLLRCLQQLRYELAVQSCLEVPRVAASWSYAFHLSPEEIPKSMRIVKHPRSTRILRYLRNEHELVSRIYELIYTWALPFRVIQMQLYHTNHATFDQHTLLCRAVDHHSTSDCTPTLFNTLLMPLEISSIAGNKASQVPILLQA
jgi:hypothetical protein